VGALVLAVLVGGATLGGLYYHGVLTWNEPSRDAYPVRGVDVSSYQGQIDWPVLADQGIDFAFIKATEGSSFVDPRFADNWTAANQTDLAVGAYHFFSAESPGATQAANFVATVPVEPGMLPPVVDVERYGDVDAARTELQALLDALEAHYGQRPIIYTTDGLYDAFVHDFVGHYPLWIRSIWRPPALGGQWTFWQYSNRGRLDGYDGPERFIDLNVFSGTHIQLDALRSPRRPH